MKLVYVFLIGLTSIALWGCTNENQTSSIQADPAATALAPLAIGEVVATSCIVPSDNANSRRYGVDDQLIYYSSNPFIFNDRDAFWRYIEMFRGKRKCLIIERRFEGITTQGLYLVRDYEASNQSPMGTAYTFPHLEDVRDSAFKTEILLSPNQNNTTLESLPIGANQYKDGIRTGWWEISERAGILGPQRCEGEYGTSGERQGLWTCWISNGMMVTQGQYLQGKMHGRWTTWRNENNINTQGLYINGIKEGWWIETAPGEYRTQGYYRNDLREGVWVTLNYDGSVLSKGSYIHNLKDGCWDWFLNEKKIQHGCFREGVRIGIWKRWHFNGTQQSQGEFNAHGNPVGDWISWDDNSNVRCTGVRCNYFDY